MPSITIKYSTVMQQIEHGLLPNNTKYNVRLNYIKNNSDTNEKHCPPLVRDIKTQDCSDIIYCLNCLVLSSGQPSN